MNKALSDKGATLSIASGKWQYSFDTDSRGREGYRIDSTEVSMFAWLPIGEGGSDQEDNAKLIIAAPQLLMALKATANVIRNILTDSQLDERTPCGQTIREWSKAVDIAIAAAE